MHRLFAWAQYVHKDSCKRQPIRSNERGDVRTTVLFGARYFEGGGKGYELRNEDKLLKQEAKKMILPKDNPKSHRRISIHTLSLAVLNSRA
jgi:hypothetical protein